MEIIQRGCKAYHERKNKYTTAGHTIYITINTVMKGNINMSVVSFNKDDLENVKNSGKIILLDFYADWCGPCRMLSPVVDEFAEENPDFVVGKINVDKEPELSEEFGVSSIPMLVVMKDGKILNKSVGAKSKQQILEMIEKK